MTPDNDNSPDARPAEFDARVMAHLPMVANMAKKWVAEPRREDFVQDVLTYAIRNWRTFRNLETYEDFTTWMRWQVRAVMTSERNRRKRTARSRDRYGADYYGTLPSHAAPSQEHTVAVADALALVRSDRSRDILIRRAMGDGLLEIASDLGVSKERVRQLEVMARKQATSGKPRARATVKVAA